MEEEFTYQIIRFYKDGRREVVETDLSLQEAKDHCADKSTCGNDWFDGFEKE